MCVFTKYSVLTCFITSKKWNRVNIVAPT